MDTTILHLAADRVWCVESPWRPSRQPSWERRSAVTSGPMKRRAGAPRSRAASTASRPWRPFSCPRRSAGSSRRNSRPSSGKARWKPPSTNSTLPSRRARSRSSSWTGSVIPTCSRPFRVSGSEARTARSHLRTGPPQRRQRPHARPRQHPPRSTFPNCRPHWSESRRGAVPSRRSLRP